jgi:hypothetical protein
MWFSERWSIFTETHWMCELGVGNEQTDLAKSVLADFRAIYDGIYNETLTEEQREELELANF